LLFLSMLFSFLLTKQQYVKADNNYKTKKTFLSFLLFSFSFFLFVILCSFFLSLFLSFWHSVYLSLFLSFWYSVCLSLRLFSVFLSFCLSFFFSFSTFCLYFCPSFFFFCFTFYLLLLFSLSFSLSVCLSFFLSIFLTAFSLSLFSQNSFFILVPSQLK
jgi:hypothetical protein